mmetsp:Transcript_2431/g.3270  ORF Transcript_2431/g.3270 Transcript_2431/m.3270 type:complete len:131 (-) Transcript_2431:70-462(-)
MGNTTSLTLEERAASDAKHAQVLMMKESLLKKVEEHEERLHGMEKTGDPHLAVFKDEMMKTVDEHMDEHVKMDAEQEQLAQFKEELMEKVHEHMNELHLAEDKAQQVAKFKQEMAQKVEAHMKHVGLTAQ